MTTIQAQLHTALAVLQPQQLELIDDSALHAGHAGAREGGHFRLRIVSAQFAGLSRLARHKAVNAQVAHLLRQGIHALSISALTPEEAGLA